MQLTIKKLTPELAQDFMRFFDHDAFADHDEWAGCYCLESHISREENERLQPFSDVLDTRRRMAEELVAQGVMTGYLIYDGDTVVGWCNAGDKLSYAPVCDYEPFITDPHEPGKIKLIYCFDIAPAYRGQGIARRLIEHILAEAKEEGYFYAEAHPSNDHDFPYQYHGPLKLYEDFGFETVKELAWCYLVRKKL